MDYSEKKVNILFFSYSFKVDSQKNDNIFKNLLKLKTNAMAIKRRRS
jgi:hypothetical protein